MDRSQISALVIERLIRLLERKGESLPSQPDEATVLIGSPEAVLDSLGWVQFSVDLEQVIDDRFRKGAEGVDSGFAEIEGLQACTVGSLAGIVHQALTRSAGTNP